MLETRTSHKLNVLKIHDCLKFTNFANDLDYSMQGPPRERSPERDCRKRADYRLNRFSREKITKLGQIWRKETTLSIIRHNIFYSNYYNHTKEKATFFFQRLKKCQTLIFDFRWDRNIFRHCSPQTLENITEIFKNSPRVHRVPTGVERNMY